MLRKICSAVIVFALAVQLCGCAAFLVGSAVGAAGVIWAKGRLQEELNASPVQVHNATLTALKKLDLPVKKDASDQLTAKVESEFADGKYVWIDIKSASDTTTRIRIRVGSMGDEQRSRKLLDVIRSQL